MCAEIVTTGLWDPICLFFFQQAGEYRTRQQCPAAERQFGVALVDNQRLSKTMVYIISLLSSSEIDGLSVKHSVPLYLLLPPCFLPNLNHKFMYCIFEELVHDVHMCCTVLYACMHTASTYLHVIFTCISEGP